MFTLIFIESLIFSFHTIEEQMELFKDFMEVILFSSYVLITVIFFMFI